MVLKGLTIWVSTRIPAGGTKDWVMGAVWPERVQFPPSRGRRNAYPGLSRQRQEEENEGLQDAGQHLHHMPDCGA